MTDDEDDEPDVDLEKFSLSLSQFKKPARKSSSGTMSSDASSSADKGRKQSSCMKVLTRFRPSASRTAKKRRTSTAPSEDDDFIAPSDESEADEPPPTKSRTASMSGSASGMDVDSGSDEDEAPKKKKATKAKVRVVAGRLAKTLT